MEEDEAAAEAAAGEAGAAAEPIGGERGMFTNGRWLKTMWGLV